MRLSKRGRPLESGYRSQVVLLFSLTTKGPLCFHELAKESRIDENRVSPNLRVLVEKGLVKKHRNGHKMMYEASDKNLCTDYLMKKFLAFAQPEDKIESTDQSMEVKTPASRSWKQLREGTDFVVDKKIGVITLTKAAQGPVRVTYRAGYEKTPEAISEASARLAAGFLKWIVALKLKETNEANMISRETWKKVRELIEPFKMSNLDKQRTELLEQVSKEQQQVNQLEKVDGLKIYNDHEKLLKWTKELKKIEELKKTRDMTKGAYEFRVGPKCRDNHEET
jgi:predicted transcriptional regulator